MTGRQLVQALAGRQQAQLIYLQPHLPLRPAAASLRPCGCDLDVTVFGHTLCVLAPPWTQRTE